MSEQRAGYDARNGALRVPHDNGDSSRPGEADGLFAPNPDTLGVRTLSAPFWGDGAVTLYLGDCLDILPLLDRVDVTLTDPPYARDVYQRLGMLGRMRLSNDVAQAGGKGRTQGDRLGNSNHQYSSTSIERLAAGAIGSIDEILEDVAREIARLTRRWSLVFSDVETCHRWRERLEANGLRYVRTGAWVKDDPMPQFSGDRPAVGFEPCTIAHTPGPMHWNGGGSPAVWRYGTVKRNRPDHPCPKPLPLMRELVRLFTDPGETILDCFAGSGTTGIAARIEGRKAILIEKDERYAEVAARRLQRGDVGARKPDQAMFNWAVVS